MSHDHLYITGGKQRKNAQNLEEWNAFQEALLLQIDLKTLKVKTVLKYKGSANVVPDFPSHVFKAANRTAENLYLCTQTEILILDTKTRAVKQTISHPWLNDVHHVLPAPDGSGLYVANTGLDQILKLSPSGEVEEDYNTADTPTWERFDQNTDYRKIESTKPHHAHPNHLFFADDRLFATRFQQKDAICLSNPDIKFVIGENYVHDGIVSGSKYYFTTVDGKIFVFDGPDTRPTIIDLNDIHKDDSALGWCRGIYPISEELLWIGFTRLRPTKIMEHLSWVKHGFKKVGDYNTLPTRLVLYDIKAMKKLEEIDLEPYGFNALFSIL